MINSMLAYFSSVAAPARTTTSAPRSPLIASRDRVACVPTNSQAGLYADEAREDLLVVCFDLRLLDNLNTAIETVGRNTMAQVRFT